MNKIQIYGLCINLIVYTIMVFPIYVISFINTVYNNKKNLISSIVVSIIIETVFSLLIYTYPSTFFKLFSNTPGVINYAIYAFKILFIPSSLYGIKILVPKYLRKNQILEIKSLESSTSSKESINTKTLNRKPIKSNCSPFLSLLYKIKIANLMFSKIAITIILIILGYFFFNTKGILFAIPFADFIYITIYTILLLLII